VHEPANHPQTLVGLLEHTGTRVSVFDMGRRIGPLAANRFAAFEAAQAPYPLPLQHKAWIAVVQQPRGADADPVVWFLHLDLDEQGLLVQATRDDLLERLLTSAQAGLDGTDTRALWDDNPCAFTPDTARMAQFHARLGVLLQRPPSRFHAHAADYFSGALGWSQWEFVGYQGIADLACRQGDAPLDRAIAHLAAPPLQALCHCLEHARPSDRLLDALRGRLSDELQQATPDTATLAALVRAMAVRAAEPAVRESLAALLGHDAGRRIEVLAALSGRAWEALDDRSLMDRYLVRLAANDHGQQAFEACLDDLLGLPGMRDTVRAALRDPAQPDAVRAAFGVWLARAARGPVSPGIG
jgi:hypothetical protein